MKFEDLIPDNGRMINDRSYKEIRRERMKGKAGH
jgi:hypothetical protein